MYNDQNASTGVVNQLGHCLALTYWDRKKGNSLFERGLFTGEISRISRISSFLEFDQEDGRNFLCFPQSGNSLETLESLKFWLESLENGLKGS